MAFYKILLTLLLFEIASAELIFPDDVGLTTAEKIVKYGYPLENHWVVTEDGYILNMHRIPHGRNNANDGNRPAVLVMHGLFSSGGDFLNNGPEKSVGFLLADMGYDVWLGNARGNTNSRNHTTLNPDEKEFWEFSWNEIGYYDIAAKIDYIIETSGQDQIFYIGHSQGTTVSYALLSQRPEYNEKLRLVVSFAPVAYMKNLMTPIFQIASLFYQEIRELLEGLGWYELLMHFESDEVLAFCADGSVYQDICGSAISIIGGYNRAQINTTLLPVYLTNLPAGGSYRQLIHYAQEIISGHFRLYDHGAETNLEIYGQEIPPDYDLSQITAPVALFYTDNDWCSAGVDVEQLYSELENGMLYKLEDPRFNHVDFLWAIDIVPLLLDKVFTVMSEH